MAQIADLPRLVRESYEMTKAYLRQETVEPAKRLGRFTGISLGAAALWMIGTIFLAVAGLRALIRVLPSGVYYEALGYVVFAVLIAVVAYLIVRFGAPDGSPSEGGRR